MVGAPAVVALIVTLRPLLPAVATLARASALATARRALPSVAVLARLRSPLLLREEQLAVYARWWQRVIFLGAILYRTQPAISIF
jgi:hypothetical protein